MSTPCDDALRSHLSALLAGGQAFDTFDSVIGEFATEERGVIPPGAEHSPWQIVEHLRFSLRDILDFTRNEEGNYLEKNWPADYWNPSPLPSPEAWDSSIRAYRSDLKELERLVMDPESDLFRPLPWGDGQTLMREVLLAANHEAYHLGELVELKRWIDGSRAL